MNTVAVVGGGAAGLMAAGTAARFSDVTLFERNEKQGKKLYITGKGRCNFTNAVAPEEFLRSVVRNPKFLYGAINKFTPDDAMAFMESRGVRVKVERGNRAFPVSDKASDITKALTAYCKENGVSFALNTYICAVNKTEKGYEVKTSDGEIRLFDKVILACGGKSYPSTGSDGNGYALARNLQHKIIEPRASLIDIKLKDNVKALEGLSLKNVSVSIVVNDKTYEEQGEMLFTADGVSGPIILTLSSYLSRIDYNGSVLRIDLKPALDKETLDKRILRDFDKYKNKFFRNALDDLLPSRLIMYIVERTGIESDKYVNSITKEERAKLVSVLKGLTFTVDSAGALSNAVVTSGGVDVSQVNPSTMESKLCKGLYFAGEMLDVDALTGGFNIQIALSTGYTAGISVGRE